MLHLLLLITLVNFSLAREEGEETSCIYSQSHWLRNISEPWPTTPLLNQSLCGVSWYALMHLNTSQTRDGAAMHWLIAFHQLCTAVLNVNLLQEGTSPQGNTGQLPSPLALAIDVIFDSMQRYCDNLAGWISAVNQDTVLQHNLATIVRYNHGSNVCEPVSFLFTQEPQLFFLDYNDTEQAEMMRQANVMKHLYRIQMWLILFSCLSGFLVIPALVIYIIMIRNEKREYFFFRPTEAETYNASGGEGNMQEISYEEELEDSPRSTKEKKI